MNRYIKIWRIEIGLNRIWTWDAFQAQCGCRFLDLGPIYFVWITKECNRPIE